MHGRGHGALAMGGRSRVGWVLAVPMAGVVGVVAPGGAVGKKGQVTEFSAGITPSAQPEAITAGPDGNLWFIEERGERIGRITPTGEITEFSAGSAVELAGSGITAGPDGNVWFTERTDRASDLIEDRIARITPTGELTEFSAGITPKVLDGQAYSPGVSGIAAGPDGNLWFTEYDANRIGRITPTGVVTEFSAGISEGSAPNGITAGPDGNLWFTESDASRIGRITPSGVVSEFPPTAAIRGIRLHGTRAIGVRVRCPSGAARACRGTLSLRLGPPAPSDLRPQVRRLRLAPGRGVEVVFPLPAAGRRQLKVHRRLAVSALVVPTAHSTAGSIQRGAILRASDPPAVAG